MDFFSPDAFIARQNVARYRRTGKLDVYYLSRLSEDAADEMVKVLDMKKGDIGPNLAGDLYWKRKALAGATVGRWQSANLARSNALKRLDANAAYLRKNKARRHPPAYMD